MQVKLEGYIVSVKITYKKIKNMYMRFDEDNNLVISANKKLKEKDILKILENNKKSLLRMYEKNIKWQENEDCTYLWGRKYKIIYTDINNTLIENEIIYVKNKDMLNKFINSEIKRVYIKEVERIKKEFKNIPEFKIIVKKMKTRWGVCNRKTNTITLNYSLVKRNIKLLDYVIVHELSHFIYGDHSKNFWNLVGLHYPNYKEARKELNG